MNIQELEAYADVVNNDIGKYRLEHIILSPQNLTSANYCVPSLSWQSIKYGDAEIDQVPDDKRGIYAFVLAHQDPVLPPHGYVLYIGIAGRKSNRSLRDRYNDYLDAKKVIKRERIARMIGTWHTVLRFYFVPVDANFPPADLETLEKQLNSALMPPLSEGDLEAETKSKRRAFK